MASLRHRFPTIPISPWQQIERARILINRIRSPTVSYNRQYE